jgi:Xaa-Pro aminopeptidase
MARLAVSAAVVAGLLLCLRPLAAQPAAVPPAYLADLVSRRARLMATLGPDTALILWSAQPRVYSTDTDYEYRQESNLLYLTGIDQPDTTLVLAPGAGGHEASLFVRAVDPVRALWEGHTLTPAEVTDASGVTAVYPETGTEAFDAFVEKLCSPGSQFGAFSAALGAGHARLAVLGRVDAPVGDDVPRVAWAQAIARRHPGLKVVSAADALLAQREIKTPYEQGILRRGVEISAEAHIEGMKATRPGRWEYEVEAAVEYWFHKNGELSPGYPSIVASGPNATTLHYERSTRQMLDGDLLLVDAAGNYQGLTGDITRTYPVNGHFTPAQRAIYELVLRAQTAGMAAATPGSTVDAVTLAVRRVLGAGLLQLGLVTDPRASTGESPQIDLWFPHGPMHGIGMDVHEPLGRLVPGVAFVIEPGLYIRSDTLDRLSHDPGAAALVEAIAPAVARYRDIGVRIEDSFLMTPDGPEMLSATAPHAIRDLEKLVGSGH